MPDAVPEPGTQPAVDLLKLALDTSHTEVVEPASLDLLLLLDALIKGAGRGFAGNSFQVLFEPLPTLFTHYQLVLAFVAFAIGGYELIAQYPEVYRPSDTALFLIDGQPEPLVEEAVDAGAYPIGF